MRDRLPHPVVVLVGAYIVLAELDRLTGACLGADGAPATAGELFGPFGIGGREAWDTWHSSAWSGVAARVLLLHLLVDVVFYLAYTRLVRAWLSTFTGSDAVSARRALRFVLALEIVETAVAGLCLAFFGDGAGEPGGGVPPWLRWCLGVVTEAKWAALVVLGFFVACLVRDAANRSRFAATIRRWTTALVYQRLSLLVVAVLGVLALNPGPDVADQVPDVLRRWTDLSGTATRHLVAGVLGAALTAVGLFVLGRLRTERAWREYVSRDARPSRRPSVVWLVWPLAAAAAGLLLVVTGEQESLGWRFWLAVGVPLAIFVTSWIAFRTGGTTDDAARWWPLAPLPAGDRQFAETTWRAGDTLAGGVVLLLALALLRAFTAPVVLGPISADDPAARGRQWMEIGALATGVLLTVFAQPAMSALRARLDAGLRRGADAAVEAEPDSPGRRYRWSALWPPEPSGRTVTTWARITLACALAVLVVVELWPLRTTALLGVFATAQLVLLAWAIVIGIVLVQLQHHQPAEVFRLLRLRQNPVMTLVLAVLCVSSLSGGDAELHALRAAGAAGAAPAPAGPARVSLAEFTRTWLDAGAGCGFTLPVGAPADPAAPAAPTQPGAGSVTVRPLLLVAADGGGIRASRWTVDAMRRLHEAWRAGNPGCARSAVLLASGVSGGSVGLALSRTDDAVAAQRALEEPDALGAATAGLLLRDLVAGGLGLKVPALDAGGTWVDRAGLMETVWERDSRALREPFTPRSTDREGALLLNSVAAGSGCRVLVGQVDVHRHATVPDASAAGEGREPTVEAPGPDCRTRTDLPAGTFDLLHSYRQCLPEISWATAAMLSARFPFVTPAGRLEGCRPTLADLQLIDGGYGEGSGLGTLTEVATDVLDVVRTANSAATGPARTVVVPIVVFLQNRPGADVSTPSPGLSAELFVPLAGQAAKGLQGSAGSWLQRASAELDRACPPEDAVCRSTLATVWRTMPGGVVLVAPAAQPTVEPPLGWTLSAASRLRLTTAMNHEAEVCRDGATGGILGGYGRFGALLTWLREHRACG